MGKKRVHGRFGYAGNCALTSIEAVVEGADLETVIALPGALPTTVGKALVYGSDLPIPISDDLRAFVERAYARLGASRTVPRTLGQCCRSLIRLLVRNGPHPPP